MSYRPLSGQQTLLRIFIGESDKHVGKPLFEFILEEARKMGIAGCSVFRGAMGFGAGGAIHSDFPPDYAINLPIIVELVDTQGHVSRFLNFIEPYLQGTLVTEEKLHIHHYRHHRSGKSRKETGDA